MADPYIRARGVTKTYRSGASDLVVFENLNLDVERGEMLALVGESGAGKSTLLHLLGGLDSPSRGTIHYGSREITGLPPNRSRGCMKWALARGHRTARVNFRAGNSSASCWPVRWWENPAFCWPMSLPATWTSGPARWFSNCWKTCTARIGLRRYSSRTIWGSHGVATGC